MMGPASPQLETTPQTDEASSRTALPTHRIDKRVDADSSARHKIKPCRFYASKSGCRAGEDCPFLHSTGGNAITESNNTPNQGSQIGAVGKQAAGIVPERRVVPKPVPQNLKVFHLNQIRKRFSPKESRKSNGDSVFQFNLKPSDPDFAFELSYLECALNVPASYPELPPSLKVKNSEIPVGIAVNIERGFDDLVAERKNASLLDLVNALDRNLEKFLSMEQAKTVKLVSNADRRHLNNAPVEVIDPSHITRSTEKDSPSPRVEQDIAPAKIPAYTANEKIDAQNKRNLQVKQLESRLGRHASFRKSQDGIAFTLPIEPRMRGRLPSALKAISTVVLYVPLLYPLEPCRVRLDGLPQEDSRPVEVRFEERARAPDFREWTLMAHLNFLSQNLHTLALPLPKEELVEVERPVPYEDISTPALEKLAIADNDRSHVIHIPRPPEWDLIDSSDFSEDSDDDSDSSEHSKDSNDLDAGGVKVPQEPEASAGPSSASRERGTAISFPYIELFGIELLEISILNISVKCERCKDTTEVTGLKDGATKNVSCKKCAIALSIAFRKELVHVNSVRAGFLDLEGCTVGDMLPSTFIPTCSQCSTASTEIVSVRGETITNVCRESGCHQKFTFKIPEIKYLRITSANRLPPAAGPRRKKEVLGLAAGQELPKRGRCQHYAKSYRWFRFSCCQKVYPCDRCHDEAEEHPNEHGNRMICGFCSREQNYRPEDCSICHSVLVGKKGHGFWEGGKGTRDKVKMSRKDPRKYKRPGTAHKS